MSIYVEDVQIDSSVASFVLGSSPASMIMPYSLDFDMRAKVHNNNKTCMYDIMTMMMMAVVMVNKTMVDSKKGYRYDTYPCTFVDKHLENRHFNIIGPNSSLIFLAQ